jgi:hypothetical protein
MTSNTLTAERSGSTSVFILLLVIAAWAGSIAVLSTAGTLDFLAGLKVAPLILATILLPVLLYFVVLPLRRTIDGIGLRGLTAVHLLRYAGAAWILHLGANGIMQPLLARFAGWGDIVAATVALVVLLLPLAPWRYVLAHGVSLSDFMTSLVVGMALTLAEPAQMEGATRFPVAMILFFIIGFYASNSLICLNTLLRGRTIHARA